MEKDNHPKAKLILNIIEDQLKVKIKQAIIEELTWEYDPMEEHLTDKESIKCWLEANISILEKSMSALKSVIIDVEDQIKYFNESMEKKMEKVLEKYDIEKKV